MAAQYTHLSGYSYPCSCRTTAEYRFVDIQAKEEQQIMHERNVILPKSPATVAEKDQDPLR